MQMQKTKAGFQMKNRIKLAATAAALLILFIAVQVGSALPDSISVFASEDIGVAVSTRLDSTLLSATVSGDSATVRLLGVLPVKNVRLNVYESEGLYLGGMAFGVKLFTEGVLVVGISGVTGFGFTVSPATDAGIQKGDVLLSVNGVELDSAETLKAAIEVAGATPVTVKLRRGDETITTTLYPALSAEDNKYRAGLWVRDSTAGIGTITYIDAESGAFAGLGHGICDSDTGALMPLGRGVVVDVDITGVKKGTAGVPGELKGSFDNVQRGTIERNAETGVYGTLDSLPQGLGEPMPVGLKDELETGTAYICTTLNGNTAECFKIEIEKIYKNSGKTKNFLIKVTDPSLLEQTGGIVQGMSGSPIIQNGKIVGAVTHVLINDPTRGYGIFIENMLETAE